MLLLFFYIFQFKAGEFCNKQCLWLPKIHMLKLNPSVLLYKRIWYLLSLSIHKVRRKWKTKHKEWKLQKGVITCQTFLNFQIGCLLNTSQVGLWKNGWIVFIFTSQWKKTQPRGEWTNPGMTSTPAMLLQGEVKQMTLKNTNRVCQKPWQTFLALRLNWEASEPHNLLACRCLLFSR